MSVNLPIPHRITVEEYHRMGEEGFFPPDARVELIEGEVIEMSPIGGPHVGSVNRLTHVFVPLADPSCIVSIQNPIRWADSEPMPDVAVLRPQEGWRDTEVPRGEDCVLVIEVADSSLLYDRNRKSRIYAQMGIPEYWVMDVPRSTLIRHTGPGAGGYDDVTEFGASATISTPALGNEAIPVRELFTT